MRSILSILFFSALHINLDVGRISIDKIDILESHEVHVFVSLRPDKEAKLYNWRGHIYPLLDTALFISGYTSDGDRLYAQNVPKVMPKFPHRNDVVISSHYKYEHPLRLVFFDEEERIVSEGCIRIKIKYDTTSIEPSNILTKIILESVFEEFCFE